MKLPIPKKYLILGGIGIGLYIAWDSNLLGIRSLIENMGAQAQDFLVPDEPYTGGTYPQTVHKGNYPFPYPYPPTSYPMTAAPTTQAAAHYKIAGTPNLGVRGAGLMPNPSLWMNQGGISNPRMAIPGARIDYGPFQFDAPIFSNQRYSIQGTNISLPFLIGPVGPSPCPVGEYRASDGRCYRMNAPPPEPCPNPNYYRASDGRCYPFR